MKKIITFILALVMIMSMVACGSTTNEDPITSTQSETPVVENIPTTSEEPVETPSEDNPSYTAEIIGCSVVDDYEGNPALVIFINWTNNSEDTCAYWITMATKAFQNGIGLDTTYLGYDSQYSDVTNATMTEVRPGTTIEVAEVFALQDTSAPVEIEISELISFDSTILESGIYNFS